MLHAATEQCRKLCSFMLSFLVEKKEKLKMSLYSKSLQDRFKKKQKKRVE